MFNLLDNIRLGFKHFRQALFSRGKAYDLERDNYFAEQNKGIITLKYPDEKMGVPEIGRYQLDVEMDDCIVCDLCAKACPVNCIKIEAIKSVQEIGTTSDGTKKRLYPAKFEIDMAKCMFCGLCTIPCPTECLIMTDKYEVASKNLNSLNYVFAQMSQEEQEEKKAELQRWEEEKKQAKLQQQQSKAE